MTRIDVTAADITAAEAGETHDGRCSADPVAHAMRRTFNRPVYVDSSVYQAAAHVWHMGVISLSDQVRDYLAAFKASRPVAPMSFTVARDAN